MLMSPCFKDSWGEIVVGVLVLGFLEIEAINWTELTLKVMTSIFEKRSYTIWKPFSLENFEMLCNGNEFC